VIEIKQQAPFEIAVIVGNDKVGKGKGCLLELMKLEEIA